MEATVLPQTLVRARYSLMNLSMPKIGMAGSSWCWTTAAATRVRQAVRPSPSARVGCARSGWRATSPHLNPKERDTRSHLARTLREFVDDIIAGLGRLGGERQEIVDKVSEWFIAGHRKAPRGRPQAGPGARRTRARQDVHEQELTNGYLAGRGAPGPCQRGEEGDARPTRPYKRAWGRGEKANRPAERAGDEVGHVDSPGI